MEDNRSRQNVSHNDSPIRLYPVRNPNQPQSGSSLNSPSVRAPPSSSFQHTISSSSPSVSNPTPPQTPSLDPDTRNLIKERTACLLNPTKFYLEQAWRSMFDNTQAELERVSAHHNAEAEKFSRVTQEVAVIVDENDRLSDEMKALRVENKRLWEETRKKLEEKESLLSSNRVLMDERDALKEKVHGLRAMKEAEASRNSQFGRPKTHVDDGLVGLAGYPQEVINAVRQELTQAIEVQLAPILARLQAQKAVARKAKEEKPIQTIEELTRFLLDSTRTTATNDDSSNTASGALDSNSTISSSEVALISSGDATLSSRTPVSSTPLQHGVSIQVPITPEIVSSSSHAENSPAVVGKRAPPSSSMPDPVPTETSGASPVCTKPEQDKVISNFVAEAIQHTLSDLETGVVDKTRNTKPLDLSGARNAEKTETDSNIEINEIVGGVVAESKHGREDETPLDEEAEEQRVSKRRRFLLCSERAAMNSGPGSQSPSILSQKVAPARDEGPAAIVSEPTAGQSDVVRSMDEGVDEPQPAVETKGTAQATSQSGISAIERPARHRLSIKHLVLIYRTVGEKMYCRMCSLRREEANKKHPATIFPVTASWNELAGHCETVHPVAAESLAKLSAAQIVEMRQQL